MYFTVLLGIAAILVWSFNAFDLQSVFAQTPGDPSAGPIPEGNYTDPNLGPIPEDNTTDMTPQDNTTSDAGAIPDSSGLDMPTVDPLANDTMPSDNSTDQQDNMAGSQNIMQQTTQSQPSTASMSSKLPPLEQVKSGVVPKDIQCKQGFTLILKAEDGSPACVEPQVAQVLMQRGW